MRATRRWGSEVESYQVRGTWEIPWASHRPSLAQHKTKPLQVHLDQPAPALLTTEQVSTLPREETEPRVPIFHAQCLVYNQTYQTRKEAR